jgi:hypothetical protein
MAPSPSLAFDQMGNAGLTVQLIRFSSGRFAFSNFIAFFRARAALSRPSGQ